MWGKVTKKWETVELRAKLRLGLRLELRVALRLDFGGALASRGQ